jgi:hypothetical protein
LRAPCLGRDFSDRWDVAIVATRVLFRPHDRLTTDPTAHASLGP